MNQFNKIESNYKIFEIWEKYMSIIIKKNYYNNLMQSKFLNFGIFLKFYYNK